MAKRLIKDETLTAIANAIRSKTDANEKITVKDFPYYIESIEDKIDTSDATAQANDIKLGQTAYVNGEKISGTHICSGLDDLTSDATAITEDILSGKTAYVNGAKLTGTMVNNGSIEEIINAGENYSVPEGYHDGNGIIIGASLASQTAATATANDIKSGKTAYVNGEEIIGTYVEGSLKDATSDANATAENILLSKTAYVDGVKIVGAMPNNDSISIELSAGESTVISKGYHDGTGSIIAKNLASQTVGDAISSDIVNGKVAWVNGLKVTGIHECSGGVDTSDATTIESDVRYGKTYYANGEKKTGTMVDVEQAIPSISVDSNGLITATSTQSAGYISASTKTSIKQLATQAAKTVTPSASNQIAVSSDVYTTGTVTVAGDSNLVSSNIKSGVSIFGVTGTAQVAETNNSSVTLKNSSSGKVLFFVYDKYYIFNGSGSQSGISLPIGSYISVVYREDYSSIDTITGVEEINGFITLGDTTSAVYKITDNIAKIVLG